MYVWDAVDSGFGTHNKWGIGAEFWLVDDGRSALGWDCKGLFQNNTRVGQNHWKVKLIPK